MEQYPLMALFTQLVKPYTTVILDLIWLDQLPVLVLSVGGLEWIQYAQVRVLLTALL